jgi:L-threonylcarbamoyladenylate synthase
LCTSRTLDRLVTEVSGAASKLMAAFWPGPLTLLLPRSGPVPDAVTAGRALVGVRMPAHPVPLELIRLAGVPVAAPSANIFGHTSPTSADHVLDDLNGLIDAVLDAGSTLYGVESTVIDPSRNPMIVYRPGSITLLQIRDTAGAVEMFQPGFPPEDQRELALPSPGVGLRHYAPVARLILVETPLADMANRLNELAAKLAGECVGVMLPAEVDFHPTGAICYPWGRWSEGEELAHGLYSGLRWLDAQRCTVIVCPMPSREGIGAAIRDRLSKAAQKPE